LVVVAEAVVVLDTGLDWGESLFGGGDEESEEEADRVTLVRPAGFEPAAVSSGDDQVLEK